MLSPMRRSCGRLVLGRYEHSGLRSAFALAGPNTSHDVSLWPWPLRPFLTLALTALPSASRSQITFGSQGSLLSFFHDSFRPQAFYDDEVTGRGWKCSVDLDVKHFAFPVLESGPPRVLSNVAPISIAPSASPEAGKQGIHIKT